MGGSANRSRYTRRIRQGSYLFSQGDPAREAYVLDSGRIQIVADRSGRETPIAELTPGALFGESALLGHSTTRSAGAKALSDCELTVLTPDYLALRLREADPLLRHLLQLLMTRSRSLLLGVQAEAVDRETQTDALRRLRDEQALEQAIEERAFSLALQPVVRLADGQTVGYEALLRWCPPGGKPVPPSEFIPLAEETGLIVPLGRWVAHASAEAAARLGAVAAAGARPYVAFNLSGRQLSDGALFDVVAASMDQFGLEPAQLRMEVTESLLMADLDQAAQLLGRCRELGLKLAVDDFGTGYSSLAYLSRFPVDVIKLDRSFVIPLGEPGDERPRVIVGGVLRLCRELGFDHVVEGVETEAQRALLRSLGCEQAQGYHFSRPRPLADWLASASPSPPLPVAS